jgi:putative cardiolipin synthase
MLTNTSTIARAKQFLSQPLRSARACGAVFLFAALAGCAGLPANTDRPVTHSIAVPGDTVPFGRIVKAATPPSASEHHLSGFHLLGEVAGAYGSRIALIDGATKTLDLQYYSIHYDGSTETLLNHLKAAAARGVRVRVLVDDFNTGGKNSRVLRMDETPGIAVRVFNPVRGPRQFQLGRLAVGLLDFDRIQQRMHNKALIADNTLAIAGGRNLGDEYFGQSTESNFLDLDVLVAGPLVPEFSRSFDRYWNDILAYPAATIWPLQDRPAIAPTPKASAPSEKDDAQAAIEAATHPDSKSVSTDGVSDAAAPSASPQQIKPATQAATAAAPAIPGAASAAPPVKATAVPGTLPIEEAIRQGKLDLTWAPAILLADKPSKIDPEFDPAQPTDGLNPLEAAPGKAAPTTAKPSDATVIRNADADNGGPTVVDGLVSLIGGTRRDVLLISPYFVPGQEMMDTFAKIRARGVRVRVVTNSLASNDAPLAHVGYARYRKALLKLGVELYELKAKGETDIRFLGSAPQSRYSLHAKALVRDGSLLVVGSMNLDLRSQIQNTEVGMVIRSRTLAQQLTEETEKTIRDCYRVELGKDGSLRWYPPANDTAQAGQVLTREPGASVGLELLLKLVGPLAPETLL